jgi:flavorubredoxin
MTRIDSVGENLFRIHTPVTAAPGGFSFNQYLLVDEEPLLYHTGPRALAPAVIEAIARVMPIARLRWIGFCHVEADECGGLNTLLAAAPAAQPVCGRVAAMVSVADLSDRPPRALGDGESFTTGRHELTWLDAPHLPHGWDNGFLFERTTATLFAGDLFTQPGLGETALVESDILGPSEAFRSAMDYFAHAPTTSSSLARLAGLAPRTLACMHGSAWRGDGGKLLHALGQVLTSPR